MIDECRYCGRQYRVGERSDCISCGAPVKMAPSQDAPFLHYGVAASTSRMLPYVRDFNGKVVTDPNLIAEFLAESWRA